MIEMPESSTVAKQMNQILPGKIIRRFERGTKTHKFLWLNQPDEEYQSILPGLTVVGASSFCRSIYLHLGDNMLWWNDTGDRLLYHEPGARLPNNFTFAGSSKMTITHNERENLFDAINITVNEAIKLGGRDNEVDHFGNMGGYICLMDGKTKGTPYINCNTNINKLS